MLGWNIYTDSFPKLKTAIEETYKLEPGIEILAEKICEIMQNKEQSVLAENKK